jgi:hypothetical protein
MLVRFRLNLVVTAGVFLLLFCSSGTFAWGQLGGSPPPAKDSPNAKEAGAHPPPELTPEQREIGLQMAAIGSEIVLLRWEEIRAQQAIEKGKKPLPEFSYRPILSAEEERIARDVLLDASHRIDEIDRQFIILNDEVHEHYSAELAARRDAVSAQRGQILEQAVHDLKSSLGQDAFDRFAKYICQVNGYSAQN